MKRTRIARLLALSAVTAAVLALPAFASAAEWTVEGEPLLEEQSIELEGTYGFESGYGSFQCDVRGEATLTPGDEGEVTDLELLAPCQGSFLGCKVDPALETPWSLEARATDVFVAEAKETWTLPGCFYPPLSFEGSIVMTPDDPEAVSSFALSGVLLDTITHLPVYASGELAVTPAATYGVQ